MRRMSAAHEHRLQVRYAETDQMGVVYHANYLVYMEEGRTRMLAERGLPYHELERAGWALVVRKAEVRYRAGARYGDEVLVRTLVERLGGASILLRYELERSTDGTLLATGSTELACVDLKDPARAPTMLPEHLRSGLS
jgi:acyl-CoA thioester hydrolase